MDKKIEIRTATPQDREVLITLFLKYLEFVDQFEHDMLPTRRNAEVMTDKMFLPAAADGNPILIAWDGDQPAGILLWVVQHVPYQQRWKMAVGYGTYLEPAYRSQKLGTLLRRRGMEILRQKGVQRLLGSVHFGNTVSVRASDRLGAIPWARLDLFKVN